MHVDHVDHRRVQLVSNKAVAFETETFPETDRLRKFTQPRDVIGSYQPTVFIHPRVRLRTPPLPIIEYL